MLRMGRSQKVEQSGQDKIEAERTSPQYGGNNPAPNSPAYQYGTDTPGVINQARPLGDKPATQRAMSESESLARDIKDGLVSGFVGTGTTLTGEANFKGMLRIDGHLSGHVGSEKGTLIISSGGQVDANIEVAAAKINGIVNGDIIATERIELGRTA
ncbi:MAG: bactofilin family protein, partial [Pyrinomonadaceae bacterium]